MTDDEWEWGRLVTPDGELIPPGASEGYKNKHKQRNVFGGGA